MLHSTRLAVLVIAMVCAAGVSTAHAYEGVVVFHQPGANALEDDFASVHLPAIQEAAAGLGFETRVIDARESAPEEVGITPLVVFQNHRGRSIFQGRYADSGKVRHFLLTSRHVAQGEAHRELSDAPVWPDGRALQVAQIKITPLEGTAPPDFDESSFVATARDSALAGLDNYSTRDSVVIGRADRTFYFDFHPWRDADGTLYVSSAIFSQFNCHEPVWKDYQGSVSAPWGNWPEAFGKAAANLQREVVRLRGESEVGDGYTPVPAGTPLVSWADLNLRLPAAPEGADISAGGTVEPKHWTIDDSVFESDPPVQFHFMAPLDNYQGIARQAAATLTLDANGSLAEASGSVEVSVASITLGESGLDSMVVGTLLDASTFPKATFVLESLGAPDAPLEFGTSVIAEGTGSFTMRDLGVPLTVRTEILPIFDEAGEPRLDTTTSFSIRLMETWNIEGPPGPAPANDTLEFLVRLTLKPAEG